MTSNANIESFDKILAGRIDTKESHENRKNDDLSSFYLDVLIAFNNPTEFNTPSFSKYPLEILLYYLRKTHIHYFEKYFPELDLSINTLSRRVHNLSDLQQSLNDFFQKFKADLTKHIEKEEQFMFPYIESLLNTQQTQEFKIDVDGKIQLIDFMLHHSDDQEENLAELVCGLEKLNNYVEESFAFRMLINRLKMFELDLRIHGKIEDEVLLPRAIELEKSILEKL